MSRSGSVTFTWGDLDDCPFRLAIGDLEALQDATSISPFILLERLQARRPMVKDMREVLRHGLIGAGRDPVEAARLIARWVDGRPPAESIAPAIVVLSAGLYGVPDDDPGKSPETAAEPAPSPEID